MSKNPKIHLLATGGTIASASQKDKDGYAAQLGSNELTSNVSEQDYTVITEDFLKINSPYMTPKNMLDISLRIRDILSKGDADGIVITHGTSTLEETAFFLDVTVESEQPIVLTGSQRVSTDLMPDGPMNLDSALKVASSSNSYGRGTLIAFAEKIHAARSATKRHSSDLNGYCSWEEGIIGQVHGDVVLYNRDLPSLKKIPVSTIDDKVDLIKFVSGMDSRYIEASINRGASGIVVEGYGAGNVNKEFYQGVCKARDAGCQIVLVTQCPEGKVIPCYGYDGGGLSMMKLGAISAGSLSGTKARLLLMIGLGAALNDKELTDLFSQY